jgi:hypothetical protein
MTHSGLSLADCTPKYVSQPHWGTTGNVTLLYFVSFSNHVFIDANILQEESKYV